MTHLTRKGDKFEWDAKFEASFAQLKNLLTSPILFIPERGVDILFIAMRLLKGWDVF